MKWFSPAIIILSLTILGGCAGPQLTSGEVSAPYTNLSEELQVGKILHLPTGREFTEEELYDYLATQKVIYVGESHDSVNDHAVQLKIISAMNERFPGKIAVGMEMLRRPFQADADKWIAGEIDEKEFVRVFSKSWGRYEYYKDILAYARDNKLPLLAMNRAKSQMGHAKMKKMVEEAKEGEMEVPSEMVAAVEKMEEPPKPYEPQLSEDDPYYEEYIGAFFKGHGDGKPEIARMFIKSQMLWDETMAEMGAKYLDENSDMKLIVLAGGNHVRYSFGIPRRLFRRHPAPYSIVSPWVVEYPEDKKDQLMDVDLPELPLRVADFAWGVDYEDLEDGRIMLGIQIADSEEPEGVAVMGVLDDSAAAEAGIKEGDVLTSLDGVALKEVFDLTFELSKKDAGTKGVAKIVRDGEEVELQVSYKTLDHGKED
ncbi:MAG: hypothetical protein C0608_06765 [Deltaproteobacteria bacterium]|nr:MAG: hypothetical protein C0608_06765 [Deltaproteobacteria bacterium]